jgi:hypothetical protein
VIVLGKRMERICRAPGVREAINRLLRGDSNAEAVRLDGTDSAVLKRAGEPARPEAGEEK